MAGMSFSFSVSPLSAAMLTCPALKGKYINRRSSYLDVRYAHIQPLRNISKFYSGTGLLLVRVLYLIHPDEL